MTVRTEYSRFDRLRYSVLRHLPGRPGLRYEQKYRWSHWRETDALFAESQARTAGTIAIDLGANLGEFSRRLAKTASMVHAFEPDPWTAAKLRDNLSDLDNVAVVEAAAGAQAGVIPIYRHKDYGDDPAAYSESSTICADNDLVDPSAPVTRVEMIDFVEFVRGLDADVGIVKIDIEGAEIEVLNALLDSDVLHRIGYIFCETHELGYPGRRAEFRALRARAAEVASPVINLDWH